MLDNRFWSKVKISDTNFYEGTPCWDWIARIQSNGYGKFELNGIMKLAHRLSYEEKYGTIPKGLVINHLCRNRCCVNTENHLEIVTQQENCQKGLTGFISGLRMRAKTHCPLGHKYSKENTYIRPKGGRGCKTCRRTQYLQFMQRKKEKTNLIQS